MEPQYDRQEAATATDKLKYIWLPAEYAARMAIEANPTLEILRKGQGLLSQEQFALSLMELKQEILVFENECALLATWGNFIDGLTLNIMTVHCTLEQAEYMLPAVEEAARERGAKAIISVGHKGWQFLVRKHGYGTAPRIFMRKIL